MVSLKQKVITKWSSGGNLSLFRDYVLNFTATDGDKEHEESDSNEEGNYATFVCIQFSR